MQADDFAALVADIRANGQREPVTVLDGMVLDGWHRYQACMQIGIEPQKFTFAANKDPVAFVLSENLHRRHLTPSQRAAAVVACTEWVPAHRQKKVEAASTLSTNETLAKAAGTTVRTITDAKTAHKAGLGEVVKEGALTAEQAAAVVRGKAPAEKKPKREIAPPPPADAEQLNEAQHTITELAQENEQLRDKLAVESLMDPEEAKTQTAETIRELRALVKTQAAEIDALRVSRDTYMREASEAKKSVMYWRKQAEKAGKAAAE